MLPSTPSMCSIRSTGSPPSYDSLKRKKTMNLSFSGCGFLCVYHAGVAAAIREYAPELTLNIVSGASAGSIIGAGMLCGCDIGQATSDILKVVIQARSHALSAFSPNFNLVRLLREGLRASLPADAHKICSGRLRISLTRFSDAENVVVSEFESKEELIQAIVCSCYIPGLCGFVPPSFRGVRYIDGGLSDNQPAIDANTVTVSPFTGETDICPPDWESGVYLGMDFGNTSMQFTSRNLQRIVMALFPAHPEVCSRMCRQGFEDALRFLAKNGLVSCTRCIAVRSCITLPEETSASDMTPVGPPPAVVPSVVSTATMTSAVPPPMATTAIRPRQPVKRQHYQSECESCQETVESVHNKRIALPQLVQKTLDDAEASEHTLLGYLFSFRTMKYLRFLAAPWLWPMEMMFATAKSLLHVIPNVKNCQWFVDRSTKAVNFVMDEIQNQRHLYSARFTCQLAITEMNYVCPAEEHLQRPRVPVESSQTDANWDETDMNFGLSVDLGAQSKPVQKLAELRRRDSLSISNPTTTAVDFAQAANNLEWAGLRATECDQSEEEFDTFAHVVEYTKRHEALLAFYYLDDNNKVKVCEIFDVQKDHDPPLPLRHGFSSRQSFIGEENEETDDGEGDENGPMPIDSGLSLAEDVAATPPHMHIHQRDACCSPVRELDDQAGASTSSAGHQRTPGAATVRHVPSTNSLKSAQSTSSVRSLPPVSLERSSSMRSSTGPPRVQQRRQQTHTGHAAHKRLSIPNNPRGRWAPSSDSEADGGEQFFVPERRQRTSSDEYDGEPEPSDTEEGV